MSYILDALRKSDQQRRLGGVPTLTYAAVAAVAPERSPMLFHGLLGVTVVIAVGTTIAWLRPVPPMAPEPVIMVAPIAAKPIALPASLPLAAQLPAAPAKVEAEPARHDAPVAKVSVPVLAVPSPPRKLSASVATRTHNGSPAISAASLDGADEMSGKKPMASPDMPASIRKTLPVMSVAVHAYSSTPGDRLVSINGRMLREGDTLAPDLKLEQISPDGMIFTYRGYRFRRGAQ
ncbi:MAG: general secretion pathway protein GspB [Rhodocyclales bacterium]|nr:general secretion pathway protein GspB [Rhodocyclales bacterium]